jgi:hypothetical protein
MSASTNTASDTPWTSVDVVGDHIRRSSPGGRSSETAGFDGATYTEYFNPATATPLIN